MLAENPVRFTNPNPSLDVLDRVGDILETDGEIREPLRWARAYVSLERQYLLSHPDDNHGELRLLDVALGGSKEDMVYILVHHAFAIDVPNEDLRDPVHLKRAESLRRMAYLVHHSSNPT